jgi:DNA-binding transcriptional LysR family regulator
LPPIENSELAMRQFGISEMILVATPDLTLKGAAMGGLGAALIPGHLVAEEVETGVLVRLLPELKTPGGIVHAVFPSRRGMIPAVRALLDFLVADFALPEIRAAS